jgi:hypothetical protein
LRRGGFASQREAQRSLDAIRRLLAVPDADDHEARRRLVELIEQTSKAGGALPDYDEVRRRYQGGQSLADRYTVGQ